MNDKKVAQPITCKSNGILHEKYTVELGRSSIYIKGPMVIISQKHIISFSFAYPYQLDQSFSVLRVAGWYFSFLFKF